VVSEVLHDEVLAGYDNAQISVGTIRLEIPSTTAGAIARVWDPVNRLLLAASPRTHWIEKISTRIRLEDSVPRRFRAPDALGQFSWQEVPVAGYETTFTVGNSQIDHRYEWTNKRIYLHERARLKEVKEFVQYGMAQSSQKDEHDVAVGDLRKLIEWHGKEGAWLWDPYLNATDILKTLFFSPHANSDLRALSAGAPIPGTKVPAPNAGNLYGPPFDWITQQRVMLGLHQGNRRSIKFEFRVRKQVDGRGFHDRFLIFPRRNGALAWS